MTNSHKLRPVDGNVTNGTKLVNVAGKEFTYIGKSFSESNESTLIVEYGHVVMYWFVSDLFYVPIGYIEDCPVYDGDSVYSKETGKYGTLEAYKGVHFIFKENGSESNGPGVISKIDAFTLKKPLTKHTRWINIYPESKSNTTKYTISVCTYDSIHDANENATSKRIDCVPLSWEE